MFTNKLMIAISVILASKFKPYTGAGLNHHPCSFLIWQRLCDVEQKNVAKLFIYLKNVSPEYGYDSYWYYFIVLSVEYLYTISDLVDIGKKLVLCFFLSLSCCGRHHTCMSE